MSTEELYEPLGDALRQAGVHTDPSEVHGVICGLLSTGVSAEDGDIEGLLASHTELAGNWPPEAKQLFGELRDLARDGFLGGGMDLNLLLPHEDAALPERVDALGRWTEGFLVGFGNGTAGMKDSDLSPALQEALSDLSAISNVEVPEEDVEEEEALFQQVAEHSRMAALMVFTELVMGEDAEQTDNEAPGVEDLDAEDPDA
jgi:uncharacterized protein YgfB (UPF0149 family)